MSKKLLLLLPFLLISPAELHAQAKTTHFLIGNKSFERSLFSCEDTPGCYEKNNECRWDITTCYQDCKTNSEWDEDMEDCRAICMKNSGSLSAFRDYPDIKNSVIESICIRYHDKN